MAKRVLNNKRILAVPISADVLAQLESLAGDDGLTPNAYVRQLIHRHLRAREGGREAKRKDKP